MAQWAGDPSFDVYKLPEEHDELRVAIRALAEKEIAPYAAEVDEQSRFPEEALAALNASGFNAVHIPEEYGGQGADSVAACIVIEEVARVDASQKAAWRAAAFFTVFPTAYFLLVGYTEALFCALAFGTVLAARRQRWLPAGLLGGLGTVLGPLLGAIVLQLLSESIWSHFLEVHFAVLGVLIILVVLFLPGGLMSLLQGYFPQKREQSM